MTDRIAELRALLDYEGALDDTDIDALLDCAEALREFVYHETRTMTGAKRDAMVRRGETALARLNGGS